MLIPILVYFIVHLACVNAGLTEDLNEELAKEEPVEVHTPFTMADESIVDSKQFMSEWIFMVGQIDAIEGNATKYMPTFYPEYKSAQLSVKKGFIYIEKTDSGDWIWKNENTHICDSYSEYRESIDALYKRGWGE